MLARASGRNVRVEKHAHRHGADGVHAETGGVGATLNAAPHAVSWVLTPSAKLGSKIVPRAREKAAAPETAEEDHACAHGARTRWAQMLTRVFDIDMERCACGGEIGRAHV